MEKFIISDGQLQYLPQIFADGITEYTSGESVSSSGNAGYAAPDFDVEAVVSSNVGYDEKQRDENLQEDTVLATEKSFSAVYGGNANDVEENASLAAESFSTGVTASGTAPVNTAVKAKRSGDDSVSDGGDSRIMVERAVVAVRRPATDIKNRGFSQVIAWDQNRGTVGMIHNNGKFPAEWGGVWEWSGSDINLWRVAGAGHFKGSKVDYDGVLLYNGIGNTFAAWTDLNDPSYGYVDLCHVEGSFNTRAIADFDGNEYDDILIFDGNGSFGTVLDGTTYKDIWHVDNASSNPWKILGAGSFGGKEDKLIVENSSNGHLYLWQNNDSSFKTWNWSQTDIGYLGKDSKFMVSGDFNGDGTDDIVIQKSNGEMWCWDDGNSANLRWIGNLDSTFAVESVGDYNADGKEDILLREQSSGWGGLGFWGAGYAGNWTDMNVRIETDTRTSGSKFAVNA